MSLVLFWIWTDVITGLIKYFLKISNSLKTFPASFSKSTECLSSGLHSKFLSEGIDVTSCSSTWCIPCRGSCQVPICSWQIPSFPPSFLPSSSLPPPPSFFMSSLSVSIMSLLMDIAGYSGRLRNHTKGCKNIALVINAEYITRRPWINGEASLKSLPRKGLTAWST